MSKDLWIIETERVGEDYASGILDFEDAVDRLVALGYERDEAHDMLEPG